jgi:hypothetical protein
MDHLIEYFHTLVEHEFTQDQYEVSFHEGKYNITITIPENNKSPISYYVYMMYQKKMEKCLNGFIRPENRKISVVLPIRLINRNLEAHHARLNRILRVDSSTHTE